MAITPKLRCLAEQGAAKPRSVALALVRDDLDVEATALGAARTGLRCADARVHQVPDVALQAAAEVLVQCRAARQHDVLVEPAPHVDGRGLDDGVDDGGERGQEVGRVDFGVEEDLRGEEAFVADINDHGFAVRVRDSVFAEALGFAVEAGELFDDVRADVAEFFLDALSGFEG